MTTTHHTATTRLGQLLQQQGLLNARDLDKALQTQRLSAEPLGSILVRGGVVKRRQLAATLTRQKLLRLGYLFGALTLAPATAWSDIGTNNYIHNYTHNVNHSSHTMPSADRPPVYDNQPISVPVKALIERLAFGITESSYKQRKFRYDIDTLGQGMAVRLHFKF
jgi:hypothetical protein